MAIAAHVSAQNKIMQNFKQILATMHLKTKLKRKETDAFIDFYYFKHT